MSCERLKTRPFFDSERASGKVVATPAGLLAPSVRESYKKVIGLCAGNSPDSSYLLANCVATPKLHSTYRSAVSALSGARPRWSRVTVVRLFIRF